jgi:hypothetical protein
MSDPHIQHVSHSRRPSSRSSSSFAQLADDESSDSSISEIGESIRFQGTFPSTDRVRLRWSKPIPGAEASDGWHRAGVADVQDELAYSVLGSGCVGGREGVLVRMDYNASCRGIWHAGVATLLGLDVGLDTNDHAIVWPETTEPRWTITGSAGFTGWNSGAPRRHPASRQSSRGENNLLRTRTESYSSSSVSLLRAPLPGQGLTDSSFEGSATSTPTLMSSVSSMESAQGTANPDSSASETPKQPAAPLTLHLNMNDLLPTSRESTTFSFQITGTVLIIPTGDDEDTPEGTSGAFALPRFRVLAADASNLQTVVRNEVVGSVLEVYLPKGDLRDAQTRKTVLQRGARTRCGSEGARVALRPVQATPPQHLETPRAGRQRERSRIRSSSISRRVGDTLRVVERRRPSRDGPPIIPAVLADITLLSSKPDAAPDTHAVRLMLPTPDLGEDSEWLEFGLARVRGVQGHQRAVFVCASVEGVPVRMDTSTAADEGGAQSDWLCWVKVHASNCAGGTMIIDYVVYEGEENAKVNTQGLSRWQLLLPSFSHPVGRFEVQIDKPLCQSVYPQIWGITLILVCRLSILRRGVKPCVPPGKFGWIPFHPPFA